MGKSYGRISRQYMPGPENMIRTIDDMAAADPNSADAKNRGISFNSLFFPFLSSSVFNLIFFLNYMQWYICTVVFLGLPLLFFSSFHFNLFAALLYLFFLLLIRKTNLLLISQRTTASL